MDVLRRKFRHQEGLHAWSDGDNGKNVGVGDEMSREKSHLRLARLG
jgi:hypothetical protein